MQSPSSNNSATEKSATEKLATGKTGAIEEDRTVSRATWIITPVLAVLMGVGLVAPVPFLGRPLGVVFDMLHGPAFALFAAMLVFLLPQRTARQKRLVVMGVWIFLVGGGILVEILQHFIGRSASWHDIVANTLGVTAGVLWATTRSNQSRRLRGWATAGAIMLLVLGAFRAPFIMVDCLMQRLDEPILASFEGRLEMTRWKPSDCRLTRTPDHATHGQASLRMDLEQSAYPGIVSKGLLHDWSKYETLAFDVTVDEGPPVELFVRVQDAGHTCDSNDRFEKIFRLVPGDHEIEIPLSDVAAAPAGRTMDLSRVANVHVILLNLDRPRVLHLDNVRLE